MQERLEKDFEKRIEFEATLSTRIKGLYQRKKSPEWKIIHVQDLMDRPYLIEN